MNIVSVNSMGQTNIPVSLRQKLGIKDGGKLAFIEEGDKIFVVNSTALAILNAQKEFEGEAENIGLKNEQDVVDMVNEIRRERWERLYENND